MGKVAPLSRCRHAGIGADRGELMSGAFDMLASVLGEESFWESPHKRRLIALVSHNPQSRVLLFWSIPYHSRLHLVLD